MDSIRGALFSCGGADFYGSFPISLSMKFLHHRALHDTIECEFLELFSVTSEGER